ncbi:hypothetical protein JIR001_11240 [Polycladomyces abyssicola]|uniref:Glycosyl hydrolase family 13 catalytic domain-containing protein n=1 Tax=Polycladomyces abyssicola TaxID=1125966 RepID=A0A8D5UDE4_9BACL|nr:hypothetical protein JIR001_11240 [Polycladomyces abyssicola]
MKRWVLRTVVTAMLACLLWIGSTPPAQALTPTDWQKKSIYFIMTDRFSDGDPTNNNYGGFASDKSDPRKWHGGDFQGIINQLNYIKGMGFNAIWITPVTMQKSVNAYHGYWTYDFYSVDGHLGSLAKLQELVQTAHSKGFPSCWTWWPTIRAISNPAAMPLRRLTNMIGITTTAMCKTGMISGGWKTGT